MLFTASIANRYYLPFVESSIRYFFTLGFVPWRLRKISTGDVVPEVIPLGMFTWSIESITNRNARKGMHALSKPSHAPSTHNFNRDGALNKSASSNAANAHFHNEAADMHQKAAERAFQKQKQYFSDPKRVPYPLQGDLARMPTRREDTKKGKMERIQGYAEHARNSSNKNDGSDGVDPLTSHAGSLPEKRQRLNMGNPAFERQQGALQRQRIPMDDDETKVLRYCISFTENCSISEDDVEIYEYIAPTNSITRLSVL
jgi:hypothetical protein